MKSIQKSSCCIHNPALALFLMRIGVGLLFFILGLMKFQSPDIFIMMLNRLFGWTGGLLVFMSWLVIVCEVIGGLVLLLGKLAPKFLYKLCLLGLVVISLVAFISVHWPSREAMGILFQILLTLCLIGLFITKPSCPAGVTGYSEE